MNITEITSVRQQTAERLRLAPYCRVSSDSTDQLHSFAAQIRYYSDYAKKHPEYQLVDIYADEGITGTSVEKREDFQRMMQDCRKGNNYSKYNSKQYVLYQNHFFIYYNINIKFRFVFLNIRLL